MPTDFINNPKKSKIWQGRGDKTRFELEWKIVEMVVTDLLAAGYRLAFDHDGEDKIYTIAKCDLAIMEELFACDEETLYVYSRKDGKLNRSFVKFIYGNSGYDVVSDYGISLEEVLTPANKYADQYA